MKIVGYKQPQVVAAQKTDNKPAADGKNGGNKPQNDAAKADEAKADEAKGDNKPAADGKN